MEDNEHNGSNGSSIAVQAAEGVRRISSAMMDKLALDEARHAFQLDAWAGILAGLYMGAVFPFLGKIARDNLHADVLLISLLAAAPCIGPLLAPVWARQMTGRRKMPFAVWSWVIGRGLLLFMAFVSGAWAFVILVSLVQIVASVSTPAYSTLMKEIYPDRLRGRCMGLVRVGIQASTFVVTLIAGRLLDRDVFAYHWVFPIAGVIGAASALVFGMIKYQPLDVNSDYKPQILDSFRVLKENPEYRWFAASVFIFGIGNLIAGPAMVLHQVDNLHIRNEYIGYLVNASAATAIPFYFIWGRYLDRRGPLRTVWLSVLLVAIVPFVYLVAFDWRMLLIAAVVSGIANPGIELSYINSILKFAEDDRIPQYHSIHTFLFGVRGTIAPFIGGALIKLSDNLLNPNLHPSWADSAVNAPWGNVALAAWTGAQKGAGGTFLLPVFVVSIVLVLTGAMMQVLGVKGRYTLEDESYRPQAQRCR